jgi:threonine synthase
MARAAHAAGYSGRVLITQPNQLGAHVTEFDGDGSAVISGRGLGVDLLRDDDSDGVIGNGSGSGSGSAATYDSASLLASAGSASPAASLGAGRASVTYVSTRGAAGDRPITFTEAVFAGLAPDGGLYVPVPGSFPSVPRETLDAWRRERLPYAEVAARVMGLFVGDDQVPAGDLRALCRASYGDGTDAGKGVWAVPSVAPVYAQTFVDTASSSSSSSSSPVPGGCSVYVAEHFHGPTAAFKDLALQFLGNLFEYLLTRERAKKKTASVAAAASAGAASASSPSLPTRLTILGATSGDTGSAAIAGLKGKKGVEVFILHPQGRVAAVQEMQMTTCLDRNVHNAAVVGADFDACQAGVKAAFADKDFRERHSLSAINSINWARILAQTVYYVWTWMQWANLRDEAESKEAGAGAGAGITFVVPTGNFGNALSAHYARLIGVPIQSVCVATNANDILHRFIAAEAGASAVSGGDYSVRGVTPTLAPSMDIQVASNFERYLYHAACSIPAAADGGSAATAMATHARAAALVREWTSTIASQGRLPASFPKALLATVATHFISCAADDATIDAVTRAYLAAPKPYAVCPHTACGLHAAAAVPSLRAGVARGAVVVMATAHPAKFASGTPALAEAGLYYREVEGPNARPVAAVKEEVEKRVRAAGPLSPALPAPLLGLSSRPRQCAVIPDAMGSAKAFVDALQQL